MKATVADLGAGRRSAASGADQQAGRRSRRRGRKNGKGFYDYPAKPAKKSLWPELKDLLPAEEARRDRRRRPQAALPRHYRSGSSPHHGGGHRHRSARGRCRLHPRLRLCALYGGVLSYIDGMGVKAFVALCETLAATYGAISSRRRCSRIWPQRARRSTAVSTPMPRKQPPDAPTNSTIRQAPRACLIVPKISSFWASRTAKVALPETQLPSTSLPSILLDELCCGRSCRCSRTSSKIGFHRISAQVGMHYLCTIYKGYRHEHRYS
jgi:hypothetical protein